MFKEIIAGKLEQFFWDIALFNNKMGVTFGLQNDARGMELAHQVRNAFHAAGATTKLSLLQNADGSTIYKPYIQLSARDLTSYQCERFQRTARGFTGGQNCFDFLNGTGKLLHSQYENLPQSRL